MGWVTYFVDESFLGCPLFGHMVRGSQPCVDLLRKTIRAIDSRKLLEKSIAIIVGDHLPNKFPYACNTCTLFRVHGMHNYAAECDWD